MGNQGSIRQASAVTAEERITWAHDRMMDALRAAARDRADPALVAAALARAVEYDQLRTGLQERLAREARELRRKQRARAGAKGNATKKARALLALASSPTPSQETHA